MTLFTLFFAVLVANFEFAGFAPKQRYTDWTVSMETVRTAKSGPRKNQSEHRDLPKTAVNQAGHPKKGEKKAIFFYFDKSGEKLKKLEKFLILTFS